MHFFVWVWWSWTLFVYAWARLRPQLICTVPEYTGSLHRTPFFEWTQMDTHREPYPRTSRLCSRSSNKLGFKVNRSWITAWAPSGKMSCHFWHLPAGQCTGVPCCCGIVWHHQSSTACNNICLHFRTMGVNRIVSSIFFTCQCYCSVQENAPPVYAITLDADAAVLPVIPLALQKAVY